MKILLRMLCLLCLGMGSSSEAEIITSVAVTRGTGTNFISLSATVQAATNYAFESSANLDNWGPASPILSSSSNTLVWQTSDCLAIRKRFYRLVSPPLFSTNVTGRLTQLTNGNFVVSTLGGWTIQIASTSIRMTHPNTNFNYELWGNAHENFKGKHIKDTLSNRRTLVLTDNTIVTASMNAAGLVTHVSIYDGNQSHRINTQTMTVDRSSAVPLYGEFDEHDGETARFVENVDGLRFENIYEQGDPCTGAQEDKVFNTVPLAQTYFNNLNRVDDYYDDPRLGHT